jgi:hypothetical protein
MNWLLSVGFHPFEPTPVFAWDALPFKQGLNASSLAFFEELSSLSMTSRTPCCHGFKPPLLIGEI